MKRINQNVTCRNNSNKKWKIRNTNYINRMNSYNYYYSLKENSNRKSSNKRTEKNYNKRNKNNTTVWRIGAAALTAVNSNRSNNKLAGKQKEVQVCHSLSSIKQCKHRKDTVLFGMKMIVITLGMNGMNLLWIYLYNTGLRLYLEMNVIV